jgi:hypothetical protein
MNPDLKPMLAYGVVMTLIAVLLSPIIYPEPELSQSFIATSCKSIYDGYATPAAILRAHARVESDEMDWAIGDDGKSRGRMQINESFHAGRAAAFGEYDPHNCFDALRVADGIWHENFVYWSELVPYDEPDRARVIEDLTIASYQRGRDGVRRLGPIWEYVEKVRKEMKP